MSDVTPLTVHSQRAAHLGRNANPNITPEILVLWAKICVSTDVFRGLLGEFESLDAKLSESRRGGKLNLPFLPVQTLVHDAIVDYAQIAPANLYIWSFRPP